MVGVRPKTSLVPGSAGVVERPLRYINNVTRSSCSLSPSTSCCGGSEVWFAGNLDSGWTKHAAISDCSRCHRYRDSKDVYNAFLCLSICRFSRLISAFGLPAHVPRAASCLQRWLYRCSVKHTLYSKHTPSVGLSNINWARGGLVHVAWRSAFGCEMR